MNNNSKAQWTFFVSRIVIGIGFMAHGWAKLSRGTAGFEKLLVQTKVPLAHFMSWLVPLTELLGGLALILGFFVTLVTIPLIVTMLVAMFTVQINYGFSAVKTIGLTPQGPVFGPPGYEINLVYLAGLLVLMVNGGGPYAMDLWRRRSARRPKRNGSKGATE